MSRGTQESHWPSSTFVYGGLTLCAAASHRLPLVSDVPLCESYNPTPSYPGVVWALPRSLAATYGVSIDFLSYGYLDVSVPRVGFLSDDTLWVPGFPIRTSPDHRVLAHSPKLIAGSYVLHRLLLPRHSPCALCSISTKLLALALDSVSRNRHSVYHHPYTQFQKILWAKARRKSGG